MKMENVTELRRRAQALGVQTSFTDCSGTTRRASAETSRAMVDLLARDEPPRALSPVVVVWNGRPKLVPLGDGARVREFTLSAVSTLTPEQPVPKISRHGSGLQLPALPFGYYELQARVGHREERCFVISAPVRVFELKGMREWGAFLPMYAAHSTVTGGAGDLTSWRHLAAAIGRSGGGVVATLPLMGAFLDSWKSEPSPYSPATRLFWNEFYLDVTEVPEFQASRAAQRLVAGANLKRATARFRASDTVDYAGEMALKRRVLEILAREFFRQPTQRRRAFEAFLKIRPEVERYASFRAACEQRKQSWHSWPEPSRQGELKRRDFDPEVQRYFLFVQWLVQEQMDALLGTCRERGVKFYLDLPLGVNPDGYDVWVNQQLFVANASVGAPPDSFFTKGQDWGFPPLHPHRIREEGYRYVIEYLRFQMRHTGLLRLDHVMGLHRLWWVPRGASAADGAYVSYRAEELYAILSVESHRHQTMLVGENLGTVPPEVNRAMKRHGVRTMYVAQYEMQPDARQPLREPPRDCVASINTHDMPMWAAHWAGRDIADRRQLGLITAAEARSERKRRAELRRSVGTFLRREKLLSGAVNARSVLAALLKFLGQSDAELVLVNLEDLWLETEPQNTPGTSTERVNWRRKARLSVEQAAQLLEKKFADVLRR